MFENVGWTVGNHCNARCGHCYSWKVRRSSSEFLTERDVDRVVDQLRSIGVKTVNLGGNEPIYTHGPKLEDTLLPYIIRRLVGADILVGLTTNGVTFSYLYGRHRDELRMVNDIDFSLDSPFEQEHNDNRDSNLYALVLESVSRSLGLGIDCSIIACGMRANFDPDHLEAFLALTRTIGSEFRINTLKPVEPALIPEMPTPDQFYRGFEYLMSHTDCITLGESCLTAFVGSGSVGCPCGTSSFRINAKSADGRISINPCVYMHEFKAGDLLFDDIRSILAGPEFTAFADRRRRLPRECKDSGCSYLESCRGGCSARAYLISGSLETKDPYCPEDFARRTGGRPAALPVKPHIGCEQGVRVHENYLCTWIGKVTPSFSSPRFLSLSDFRARSRLTRHLSGCEQVPVDGGAASLVAEGQAPASEARRRLRVL